MPQTRKGIYPTRIRAKPTRPNPKSENPKMHKSENISVGFGIEFPNPKPEKPEPEPSEPDKPDPCAPLV